MIFPLLFYSTSANWSPGNIKAELREVLFYLTVNFWSDDNSVHCFSLSNSLQASNVFCIFKCLLFLCNIFEHKSESFKHNNAHQYIGVGLYSYHKYFTFPFRMRMKSPWRSFVPPFFYVLFIHNEMLVSQRHIVNYNI